MNQWEFLADWTMRTRAGKLALLAFALLDVLILWRCQR